MLGGMELNTRRVKQIKRKSYSSPPPALPPPTHTHNHTYTHIPYTHTSHTHTYTDTHATSYPNKPSPRTHLNKAPTNLSASPNHLSISVAALILMNVAPHSK